jgi:hypothetical protein
MRGVHWHEWRAVACVEALYNDERKQWQSALASPLATRDARYADFSAHFGTPLWCAPLSKQYLLLQIVCPHQSRCQLAVVNKLPRDAYPRSKTFCG